MEIKSVLEAGTEGKTRVSCVLSLPVAGSGQATLIALILMLPVTSQT